MSAQQSEPHKRIQLEFPDAETARDFFEECVGVCILNHRIVVVLLPITEITESVEAEVRELAEKMGGVEA
jgi:uncharacterized protein (UPF0210 family)